MIFDQQKTARLSASLRLPLEPAVKTNLQEQAAAAGITTVEAVRQFLAVGLATGVLSAKDETDAETAQRIVLAVGETLATAKAAMAAADERDVVLSGGYGELEPPHGYNPWELTDETRSTAREKAIRTCERLTGLAAGLADVLTLLRQEDSPAFHLFPYYEIEQARSETAFLVQVVLATADDSVLRSDLNRCHRARARLISVSGCSEEAAQPALKEGMSVRA